MISRRKLLQGALGFASAAILPSGIIMPIKDPMILTILRAQKALNDADVPYMKRWVWGYELISPDAIRIGMIDRVTFYDN